MTLIHLSSSSSPQETRKQEEEERKARFRAQREAQVSRRVSVDAQQYDQSAELEQRSRSTQPEPKVGEFEKFFNIMFILQLFLGFSTAK